VIEAETIPSTALACHADHFYKDYVPSTATRQANRAPHLLTVMYVVIPRSHDVLRDALVVVSCNPDSWMPQSVILRLCATSHRFDSFPLDVLVARLKSRLKTFFDDVDGFCRLVDGLGLTLYGSCVYCTMSNTCTHPFLTPFNNLNVLCSPRKFGILSTSMGTFGYKLGCPPVPFKYSNTLNFKVYIYIRPNCTSPHFISYGLV
jgi:hypothetical protein